MATAQAISPFLWKGNQAVTKAELDRQKAISDALRPAKGYSPTGPWSTVGALADEGVADFKDGQTSQAETAAQQAVADALAKGDYQGVVGSDMATPQQSAVAQALWQQQNQENDPLRKLQLEQAQLNIDQDKNPQPIEINGQLVDPKSHEVIGDYRTKDGDKPKEPPTLTSIYDANGREQKGYMTTPTPDNPTGFVPVGSPKAAIERPEFTAPQAAAAGYADRMVQSDAILDDPKLAAAQTDLVQRGLGGIPVVGNMATSPEFQQAEQAKRDFINAILRRESGAAIAASEFDSANKQYFPQPGDSDAVLKQKAANRKNAINGVARAAGPAYKMPDTGVDQTSPDTGIDDLLKKYGQ